MNQFWDCAYFHQPCVNYTELRLQVLLSAYLWAVQKVLRRFFVYSAAGADIPKVGIRFLLRQIGQDCPHTIDLLSSEHLEHLGYFV